VSPAARPAACTTGSTAAVSAMTCLRLVEASMASRKARRYISRSPASALPVCTCSTAFRSPSASWDSSVLTWATEWLVVSRAKTVSLALLTAELAVRKACWT